MERIYQVFVSSTFSDLEEERHQALLGIMAAGHVPLAIEFSGPDPNEDRDVIRGAIGRCQFYIIILGSRYGTIPKKSDDGRWPDGERSYTEFEYDEAVERAKKGNLRLLSFVLDEDLARADRNKYAMQGNAEKNCEEEYWRFREKLTQQNNKRLYKPFRKKGTIKEEIRVFFAKTYPEYPGFIREAQNRNPEDLLEIVSSSDMVREVLHSLNSFKDIALRMTVALAEKESLAKAFDDHYGPYLKAREPKVETVFFESGSTVALVAKALVEDLINEKAVVAFMSPQIRTNNAFAYLYLWLCAKVMCYPVPEGTPDDQYGGMYGRLIRHNRRPDYSGKSLEEEDPDAMREVTEVSKSLFVRGQDTDRCLVLGAISGLQLSDAIELAPHDSTSESSSMGTDSGAIETSIRENCRGFHVGSYYNKLFKRALYKTSAPTIVLLHDSKIDSPVDPDHCHFIFGNKKTWDSFTEDYPLSLWVVSTRASWKASLGKLSRGMALGKWKFAVYGEHTEHPVIIGHNQRFRQISTKIGVVAYGSSGAEEGDEIIPQATPDTKKTGSTAASSS